MPQNLVHYVLLQFSPPSRERAINILLVDMENGEPLQISIDSGWENRVDSTDREYITALTDDWRNTPAGRIPDLIHEICRASRGPLKVIQDEHATFAHAISLLKSKNR